jgi:transcriptional regulator with XRE-family HTH domain
VAPPPDKRDLLIAVSRRRRGRDEKNALRIHWSQGLWQDKYMADTNGSRGIAGHFGRQMRRDRLAHGWSITELADRSKINAAHLSRIENGKRPPTARIASALDSVFRERRGWYLQWFDDIRTAPEIPATFRNWSDYEDRTTTLRAWTPGIFDGLAQTEGYARAQIATEPALDQVARDLRLKARMARQQRLLGRAQPPLLVLLVDEAALYRRVGSPEVMAGQLHHLRDLAALPTVTVQVMAEVEHGSVGSEYMIADDAVWSENVVTGGTYTDQETVALTSLRFDTLRAECYKASESLALMERLEEQWATGASRPTRQVRAVRA